jgi:hypothetical protein
MATSKYELEKRSLPAAHLRASKDGDSASQHLAGWSVAFNWWFATMEQAGYSWCAWLVH